MYRRLGWAIALSVIILLAAAVIVAAWPGRSTFTVSTETTFVTEPLEYSGYVDYVAALNKRLRNGVTPETNANVLIWQALGPHPEGVTMQPEYFDWLQIASPPEEGQYLVSWQTYRQRHPKADDADEPFPTPQSLLIVPMRPWTAKELPELAAWLNENEGPLALAVEASKRPHYFNPLVPAFTNGRSNGFPSAMLPNVQMCRDLGVALLCRATLRIGEGKLDSGWQDLLACHSLAHLEGRGGTAIELLVGMAIEKLANQADLVFLAQPQLSTKQILACLDNLRRLPPMPTLAEKIDLSEHFFILDTIQLTIRFGVESLEGGPDKRAANRDLEDSKPRWFTRSINWDPALKNANLYCDRMVSILNETNREVRLREMAALEKELDNFRNPALVGGFIEKALMSPEKRGEAIGNILIGLLLTPLGRVQEARDRSNQEWGNLQMAFALAIYQREHGRFPTGLDELAPQYLDKIPSDLFSGKPLIYRQVNKGYLLYSVGINGQDDEGRGYDDDPPGDDLSIHMPPIEPLTSRR